MQALYDQHLQHLQQLQEQNKHIEGSKSSFPFILTYTSNQNVWFWKFNRPDSKATVGKALLKTSID